MHADVLVVAPSGAPYFEIQHAVDAAHDGDVILVKTGVYASFAVRNHTLTIVGETGADARVDGAIRVAGVGATNTLVLSRLHAVGNALGTSTRHGLLVRHCAGSIRVQDCVLEARPVTPGESGCVEGQGAWIENCADVVFSGCVLQGSAQAGPPQSVAPTYHDGGHGAYVTSSTLAVYTSTLSAGTAGLGYGYTLGCTPPPAPIGPAYGDMGAPGDGARVENSFLFACASSFHGARGNDVYCGGGFCVCPSSGGNGIFHDAGLPNGIVLGISATGGQRGNTAPTGGSCGITTCHTQCCGAANPPCTFDGASIAGSVQTLGGSARALGATALVREGASVTANFQGEPGDVVELEITDATGFEYLASARGVRFTRQPKPRRIAQVTTLGATGAATSTWTIPDLGPGTQARTLFLQATFTSTSGERTLSTPRVVVLLDSAF